MSKRELKYAQALDALDARKAAGTVSSNEYEVRRAQLLTEAAKRPWHWTSQAAVILGVLIAAFLVLRLIGFFINASSGV